MRSCHLACLAFALVWAQAAHALEANQIFKIADKSIVVITVSDKAGKDLGLGSGVIIDPREVVTSCHVLKDAARIAVKQGDVIRAGKLRYQDTARDLCQVQLDDVFPNGQPVAGYVNSKDLEVGQSVYAIGAPRGLERTISRGIVSGLRDAKDNSNLIQTDAAISPGSSGGGLFDSEARLIGIITFGLVQENLNFAIPADWIGQLATRNRSRVADAPANVPVPAAATAPAADGRWYPAKGDRWRYRLLDGKRNVGMVNIDVMETGNGRVRERITKEGSPGFAFEREVRSELVANAFLPAVQLPGGYTLFELSAYFPPDAVLNNGDRLGSLPGEMTLLMVGRRNMVWDTRVVGLEKVKVPAGEFEAWKIEAQSREVTSHGPLVVNCRIWYSQAMQRAVKIQLAFNIRIEIANSIETLEMTAYEKAKQE
jgi:S1-C subfamily serine protease